MLMLAILWGAHAAIGAAPLRIMLSKAEPEHDLDTWQIALLLLVLPFLSLILMQHLWPTGGAASFLVRLGLLTAVVFSAEASLVTVFRTRSLAQRGALVAIAILATIPFQLCVPVLED